MARPSSRGAEETEVGPEGRSTWAFSPSLPPHSSYRPIQILSQRHCTRKMRFGETLRASVYEPWKSDYIDYAKLKKLLREDEAEQDDSKGKSKSEASWTEEDESSFVDELVNAQLEKVNAFHNKTYDRIREATRNCEAKLEQIARTSDDDAENQEHGAEDEEALKKILEKLDIITRDINQLEKYRRVNYTGFLKAAKKHDRRRGFKYRVRPLLQVRLAAMPFHSEDYSSLLYR